MRTGMTTTIINGACDIGINAGHRTSNRVFAKAGFTNPNPQKMRRTKKYCGFSQNKGHEFHNIFKFCGTTPQIIPTHVFFRPVKYFLWKIDSAFASPLPLRIPQIKSGLFL